MVNTTEGKNLASRIKTANEGHSLRWLSEQSGIPYSTLKRNIEISPEKFNVGQLLALAIALDLEPGTFLSASVVVLA